MQIVKRGHWEWSNKLNKELRIRSKNVNTEFKVCDCLDPVGCGQLEHPTREN